MGAPAKFLFDVDFAKGADRKPAEPSIALAEHALKLAEAEAAAHARGYAAAQADAKVEADRRTAQALERVAVSLGKATEGLAAIETRLECEAVDVAVAVARKLAPALIAHEPFAEISALARSTPRRGKSSTTSHGRKASKVVSWCSPSRISRSAIAASNGLTAASLATPRRPRPRSAPRSKAISARGVISPAPKKHRRYEHE
jgi:hypothetical protein